MNRVRPDFIARWHDHCTLREQSACRYPERSIVEAVHKFTRRSQLSNSLDNILWVEVHRAEGLVDVYYKEGFNSAGIMGRHEEALNDYNSDIILRQTKMIREATIEYPFIVLRTGWDQTIVDIDEPFVLRTSIREGCGDRGTLIPDSSTHELSTLRRLGKLLEQNHVPFSKRKASLCWRGCYSGATSSAPLQAVNLSAHDGAACNYSTCSREYMVNKLSTGHDVRFVSHECIRAREARVSRELFGEYIPAEIIGNSNKFQLCCQGNSFSGSFGWNLLSGSVCFSTHHENHCTTYIKPIENVEYVRVADDYSDLDRKMRYYTENEAQAAAIARNGQTYARWILDNAQALTKKTLEWVRGQYDYGTLAAAETVLSQSLSKRSFRLSGGRFVYA